MDVTLDELVNARLSQTVRKNENDRDLQSYYLEHKATATSFNGVRERLEQCRAQGQPVPPELEREFDLLKRKKAQLSQAIDNARDKNHSAARDADLTRRRIQQEIIDGAHVLCATLSGSGHEMFQKLSIEFETVIIDEAAQSIELSALIPLKYGCSKCILVGDPKQLPPTVLSKAASRFQYEQSLFVRMQTNHPNDVHLLDTQYRMHPEISRFPSAAFYDGRLRDGPSMAKLRARPWHGSELLGPYRFFDVRGLHSSAAKGHSLVNLAEVRVAMQLYERLITDYRRYDLAGKIGIITPYKGQLRELKTQFSTRYGNAIFTTVEFNTTDAFQGRECEVIIFSCVRGSSHGIGFLADLRRMNVGLTRARSSLWVLGNSQSLVQGEFWKSLINDAQTRNLYTEGDILQQLQSPQLGLDTTLNDVEMVDALPSGTPDASAPPSRPQSSTGGRSSCRPSPSISSYHLSGVQDVSSGSTTDASTRSPRIGSVHLPGGPSGGRFGLNDAAMCGYCGSYAHMTHNCDNLDAKQVSQGTCWRCGDSSHPKKDCTADRCLECGEIGHLSRACKSTRVLSKSEKDRISKDEYHHSKIQKARRERQKKRQLGDHDPKVPVIQISSRRSSPGLNSQNQISSQPNSVAPGKRKRGAPDAGKDSKLWKADEHFTPSNITKGPRGKKRDPNIIVPPNNVSPPLNALVKDQQCELTHVSA
jgi:senataxin